MCTDRKITATEAEQERLDAKEAEAEANFREAVLIRDTIHRLAVMADELVENGGYAVVANDVVRYLFLHGREAYMRADDLYEKRMVARQAAIRHHQANKETQP